MNNNIETKEIPSNNSPMHPSEILKQFIMPIRNSFGIILTRECKGSIQALVSCRRTTYAFDAFVLGKYSVKNDRGRIKKMFDEMTMDELTIILTFNFERMWYHFCLKKEQSEKDNQFYLKKLAKFNMSFLPDQYKLLKSMLLEAKPNGKLPYDFPKGRKQSSIENNLEAAVREFQEETNINIGDYVFLDDKTRYSSHISDGVKYRSMYYIAFLKNDVSIQLSLNRLKQLSEVRSLQWMDISEIRRVDYSDKRLELLVQPVFNLVKKRIHGKIHYYECKSFNNPNT